MSEVLQAKLTAHVQESNRRHDELSLRITNVEKKMETFVTYKTFMIVFTILTGILGYMVWQMNDIREKATSTDVNVAGIVHDYNLKIE